MLVSRSTSALEHVIKFCVTTEKLLPQLSLESKCTSLHFEVKRVRVCVSADVFHPNLTVTCRVSLENESQSTLFISF